MSQQEILKNMEQLSLPGGYRFIRLDDAFGAENIRTNLKREHKDLAKDTKLFDRQYEGKPIVDDGGRFTVEGDDIIIEMDWTGSTQVRAMINFNYNQPNVYQEYDEIQRSVRQETAQKLANLLHRPVLMKYQPVVPNSAIQQFTFSPL